MNYLSNWVTYVRLNLYLTTNIFRFFVFINSTFGVFGFETVDGSKRTRLEQCCFCRNFKFQQGLYKGLFLHVTIGVCILYAVSKCSSIFESFDDSAEHTQLSLMTVGFSILCFLCALTIGERMQPPSNGIQRKSIKTLYTFKSFYKQLYLPEHQDENDRIIHFWLVLFEVLSFCSSSARLVAVNP